MTGTGVQRYKDGNTYIGKFLDDKLNGFGKYVWTDGGYFIEIGKKTKEKMGMVIILKMEVFTMLNGKKKKRGVLQKEYIIIQMEMLKKGEETQKIKNGLI